MPEDFASTIVDENTSTEVSRAADNEICYIHLDDEYQQIKIIGRNKGELLAWAKMVHGMVEAL